MAIAAVTFDFWRTLYRPSLEPRNRRFLAIQHALSEAGLDNVAWIDLAEAVRQTGTQWNKVWSEEWRTLGTDKWLSLVLDNLGVTLPGPLFTHTVGQVQLTAFHPSVVPDRGVADMLRRLSSRCRLGLISDSGGPTPGSTLRRLLERDGLLHAFDEALFSDEFGRSKPHATVFLTVLDRMGAQPRQAVHVGDIRRTDVAGAQNVGMRTVRYAAIRDDRDEAFPEADAVIQSFSEIEAILDRWDNSEA